MNYVLAPEAAAELLDAATFYAQNVSIAVAENFLATFEQKARLIAEFPGIGTPSANHRRCFQLEDSRFPCSIAWKTTRSV